MSSWKHWHMPGNSIDMAFPIIGRSVTSIANSNIFDESNIFKKSINAWLDNERVTFSVMSIDYYNKTNRSKKPV